jgi:hypothetical protein
MTDVSRGEDMIEMPLGAGFALTSAMRDPDIRMQMALAGWHHGMTLIALEPEATWGYAESLVDGTDRPALLAREAIDGQWEFRVYRSKSLPNCK